MLTRPKLLAAASLLVGAASARPPLVTPVLDARAPAATDPWVSVDTSGVPVTVTPVVTVVDGATTTISAAPNDLTATVVTRTDYAEITTSTGTAPPEPTATNKDGTGSFLVCNNADGANAPFCQPSHNSSLYPGTTYYVTWDSSVFNSTNTTVILEGSYKNATNGEVASQAFSSDKITSGWSYYAWAVDSKLLQGKSAVNITLFLNALDADQNTTAKSYPGPTVLVTKPPTYHQPPPKMPTGAALYIGLPTVLGFCVIMIFGVCLWNRQARKISLGNIMSRSRHGYGIAKGRARRMGRRDRKANNIRLMDHLPEDQHYRDEPRHQPGSRGGGDDGWGQQHVYRHQENNNEFLGHARRDSDALGSLAGTPTMSNLVPLTIVKGAGHEFIPLPQGENATVADFHSIRTKTTDSPSYFTSGFYKITAGPARPAHYTFEETKYVLSGQIDVLDEATGITHHLVPGDFAFFHVGSKVKFSTKSNGFAFYAVTRPVKTPHPNLQGREEEAKAKL